MRQDDHRSFKVALVADRYLNPPAGGLDAIPILLEAGWGIVQLPPETYSGKVAEPLLEQVAEQTEEFHRRGYQMVLIGNRAGLVEALTAVGVPIPQQIEPASGEALRSFLQRVPVRPLPGA